MAQDIAFEGPDFERRAVSPFLEMGAYEALWSERGASFKSLSARFARHPGSVPSDFVSPADVRERAKYVEQRFDQAEIERFGVRVHGAGEHPQKLRDAEHPVELVCY